MIPEQRLREIASDPYAACNDCEELGAVAAELLAARAANIGIYSAELRAERDAAAAEASKWRVAFHRKDGELDAARSENERLAKQRDDLLAILNEAFDRAIAAEQPKPAGGGA